MPEPLHIPWYFPEVRDLSCVSLSYCIAVGDDTMRWNGVEWSRVELPVSGSLVGVSCVSTSMCMAVGVKAGNSNWYENFLSPAAIEWDGEAWSSLPVGEIGVGINLEEVLTQVSCASETSCAAIGWAGGSLITLFSPAVLHWDGQEWSDEAIASLAGQETYLEAVSCASVSRCFAGGILSDEHPAQLIEEFNYDQAPAATTEVAANATGSSATLRGKVSSNGVESQYYFEYGPTTAYGSKTKELSAGAGPNWVKESQDVSGLEPGATYHYRIVASNSGGTTRGVDREFSTKGWEVRPTANAEAAKGSSLEWASCVSSSSCEATGYYENGAGTSRALAERWNGSEWSIQATPNPSGAKSADLEWVACSSASACEATGHYENASGVTVTLAEHWNGTEWSLQPTPNPEGAKESALEQVSCVSAASCMASGFSKNSSGTLVTLAEHWDGTSWSLQSPPNPEGAKASRLTGLSCTSATNCEATGYYENSSGASAPFAERWNGANWALQSLPNPEPGKNSYLLGGASCSSSTSCTAAGFYINGEGHATPLAERWNGTQWSVQPMPAPGGSQATYLYGVSCTSSTYCEASGRYEKSFVFRPLTEVWNGTKWEAQSAAMPEGAKEGALNGGVSCTSSSACTSVGHYTNGAGTTVTLAERWNGTEWSLQPTPNPEGAEGGYLSGEPSCVSTTVCEVTGRYATASGFRPIAQRWNGVEWTSQAVPMPAGAKEASLTSVSCTATDACTATDFYKNGAGTMLTLAERWNGSEWSIQATPNPEGAVESRLTSVFCIGSTSCEATGYYKNGSGVWTALAERWNGSEWSIQAIPNPSGSKETKPEAVYCTSSTSCEATGFYKNGSGTLVSLAEAWNGTEWSLQSTPNPEGAKETRLYGVSCTSSTSCEATGFYEKSSGARASLAEAWNGSTWAIQSTPAPEGAVETQLYGVSCASSTACRATGYYSDGEGKNVPLVEQWNGSTWSGQSPPSPEGAKNSYPAAVSCASATTCVITGYFADGSGAARTLAESLGDTMPLLVTNSATSPTETGATLNGTVDPNGTATETYFEYGATTSYGSTTPAVSVGSGTSSLEAAKAISGLEAGHTYHFRIVASNATGTSRGEDQAFTTKVKPPSASSEAATSVGSRAATLNGSVNPEGSATSYYFEYGPTSSYGMTTLEASAGSGTSAVKESQSLSGLPPESTYHFRLVATNGDSAAFGKDVTFTTSAPKWTAQATPKASGEMSDVSCTSDSECIAVGTMIEKGSKAAAERWNGSAWSSTTAPAGSELTDVSCVSAAFCVALPSSGLNAQRWNGSEWSMISAATPAEAASPALWGISCTSPTSCVAVGRYLLKSETKTLAESYNGEKWTVLTTPSEKGENRLTAVSCTSSASCTAIGQKAGKPLALRWNGSEWTSLAAPAHFSNDISCVSSSACAAVGTGYESTEWWNGSEWSSSAVAKPEGAGEGAEIYSVSCVSAEECIAAGFYEFANGNPAPLAERWNGHEWIVQETVSPHGEQEENELMGELLGVSCSSAAHCTAVGVWGWRWEAAAERYE
jgi:hypothetical protein